SSEPFCRLKHRSTTSCGDHRTKTFPTSKIMFLIMPTPPRTSLNLSIHALIPHHHHGADREPIVQVDHVFIGHADAAGRYRMADGFRLVRAVNAMAAAPAKTLAADADAVFERLAIAENQIKPPLAGRDDDGAGRIAALEA